MLRLLELPNRKLRMMPLNLKSRKGKLKLRPWLQRKRQNCKDLPRRSKELRLMQGRPNLEGKLMLAKLLKRSSRNRKKLLLLPR